MREIGVGLLGLGNVGAGVVRLLADNAAAIEARLGARVVVKAIAVRDPDRKRLVEVDPALVTTDPEAVIDRDDVEIVCELIGGTERARHLTLRAFERGKQVVTANKALLATRGDEVFAAAERAGADLYYEAAVCGGVPIIRTLREGLASDRIEAIHGIVNGTSNFILSTMATGDRPFADVLADAQAQGFAEADPTLDVGGGDAAHKLTILAMLCFGAAVSVDEVHVEGIAHLAPIDHALARRFGYVIKPLAIGKSHDDGSIELRVHPALVPAGWLLADVPGSKNALYVRSYALGSSMYYGAGAGMMPTAMAVVSDLIEVARNIRAEATGALPLRSYQRLEKRPVRSMAELRCRYYLRFGVDDRPGVLGEIATTLGDCGVSLSEVIQEHRRGDDDTVVDIVALTHEAREGDVRTALDRIEALDAVQRRATVLRIAR